MAFDYVNEPLVPVALDPDIELQPAESQGGEYAELKTVPLASMYGQYQGDSYMHTAYSLCQYPPCPECNTRPPPLQYLCPPYQWPVYEDQTAAAYSHPAPQYQCPPYQWPIYEDQTAAAYSQPAPQYQYDQYDQYGQYDHVIERPPHTVGLDQRPAATLNGDEFGGDVSAEMCLANAASPQITHRSRKRKHESQKKTTTTYVKKPPNAFMLYMKEQRPLVDDRVTRQGCSAVNKVLAQRWRSLTKREQARYYEEAEEAKFLHARQHPEWSNRDNYGKKRKRERRRAGITSTDSSDEALNHMDERLPCLRRLEVRLERLPRQVEALLHTGERLHV